MKKSIKKNYLLNLVNQILTIIFPIITTPYLARTLGASGTGTYGYVISITTYFILFGSLGLSLYGQREVAYNQNSIEKRTKVLYELFFLKFVTMILPLIVFVIMLCIKGDYSIYFRILLLELVANCLDISWFYQGIEEFKKMVIRNLITRPVNIILVFILIKGPNDIDKYLIIYVLNSFFGYLILWLDVKKYTTKIKFKELNIVRHIKPMLILFIPQIAMEIYTVLDKTMLGFILKNMSEVGYYEQSQKIIKIIMSIVTSIGIVMLSRIAVCFSENKTDEIKKYMYKTFNYIWFISLPVIFGLWSITDNFVPLFFGAGYDKVTLIMNMLSIIVLFIGFSSVIGNQYLLTHKRQKEYTISVTVGAIMNLILNLVLIKPFLSFGAALATVIAELFVTIIQLYYIRNDFNISNIFKISKNYLIASILMFIGCYFINFISMGNIYILSIKILVGIIIYGLSLFALKDSLMISTVDTVKNKLYKCIKKI